MIRARRGRINLVVIGLGLALILPLIFVLASGFGNDPHEVPSVLERTPAPSFQLVDLDGKTVSLDSFRGRPVVLNFWSTWCGPCRIEHPLLQQAGRDWHDVTFLGVLYSDTPEAARRYITQEGSSYPILLDPGGRTAIAYGVAGVPETFVIAPDGSIAQKQVGPFTSEGLTRALAPFRTKTQP